MGNCFSAKKNISLFHVTVNLYCYEKVSISRSNLTPNVISVNRA